jgi:hypothetical protein
VIGSSGFEQAGGMGSGGGLGPGGDAEFGEDSGHVGGDRVDADELVSGGPRLFPDGLVASSWSLAGTDATDSGATCLRYDRIRTYR